MTGKKTKKKNAKQNKKIIIRETRSLVQANYSIIFRPKIAQPRAVRRKRDAPVGTTFALLFVRYKGSFFLRLQGYRLDRKIGEASV